MSVVFAFFLFGIGVARAQSSDIVFSEVLANAQDEATGEFVEIYNGGPVPVDVAGPQRRNASPSSHLFEKVPFLVTTFCVRKLRYARSSWPR